MNRELPKLNDAEARVLGVLIEKALTTPDQYPLSINATLNGCNQKSNREPVTSFVEAEVVVALQGLVPKALAGRVMSAGSRVERFRHSANQALDLDDAHLAVLAELLLRGPQTASELRARVQRMAPTPDLAALVERVDQLRTRGMLRDVAAAPGSRTPRVMQVLAPDLHRVDDAVAAPQPQPRRTSNNDERIAALEAECAALRADFDALRRELGS